MKQQPHYAARRSHLPPPPAHSVLSQRLFHHILSVTSGFPPLTHHLKIEISRLSKFRANGTPGGGGGGGTGSPPIFWQISPSYLNKDSRLCPPRAPPHWIFKHSYCPVLAAAAPSFDKSNILGTRLSCSFFLCATAFLCFSYSPSSSSCLFFL